MGVREGQQRRITKKVRAFLEAYGGRAGLNGTEAARLAGYKDAEEAAYEIRKRWPKEVEDREIAWREARVISDQELEESIATIARDPSHRDRLKALELIARMKGKLSDKLSVDITRRDISKQLEEALVTLANLALNPSGANSGGKLLEAGANSSGANFPEPLGGKLLGPGADS